MLLLYGSQQKGTARSQIIVELYSNSQILLDVLNLSRVEGIQNSSGNVFLCVCVYFNKQQANVFSFNNSILMAFFILKRNLNI